MLVKNPVQELKGSKIVIKTLESLGVNTIFGYPGGIVLDLYDELYSCKSIKHILVRHEQSAVHAAEGYARVTGKCGVVLVTSGPGATNTVTGIVNAYLDGFPLVVITGQVKKDLIGKDAFQEANICQITKTCTKKTFQVTDINNLRQTLIDAFNIANSGKKGPVVVDISKDILSDKVSVDFSEVVNPAEPDKKIIQNNFDNVVSKITNSKRPVILCGGGIVHSKAQNELLNFVNKYDFPIVSSMMGQGAFPKNSRNYLGMIGIFGDKCANELIKQSDLIISFGSRLNDRITCKFDKSDIDDKIIQIDVNEDEIGRNFKPLDYIIGDCKQVLTEIDNLLQNDINYSDWTSYVQTLRDINAPLTKSTNLLHSFEIVKCVDDFTKQKDVIFTSEVGQHQISVVKNLTLNEKRKILLSGGSGTMGFGFPAAIGAGIAFPDKTVVCFTGDGSFQMGLHELATCKDYDLDVKILIFNNGYLGMVRQLQENYCEKRYSHTKISNPDFIKLCDSYGISACRVQTYDDIYPALSKAFAKKGTFVVEFCIEPMELL